MSWPAAAFCGAATADFAPRLGWNASTNSQVTGYKLYCGTASQALTNAIFAGDNTNDVVPGLAADTTCFFAATSVDSVGDESPFSNVTAFEGEYASAGAPLNAETIPASYSTDPLTFSLDSSAPSGATINPTNGIFSWTPGNAFASTTNLINVYVADTANPNLSITETLVVVVGDYLKFPLGTTAALANQTASLPLVVAASGQVTNLQFSVNWPASALLNPALSVVPPATSGSLQVQNGLLVAQVQIPAGQLLAGMQQVGQINFQTISNQPSTAIYCLSFSAAGGSAVGGSSYVNVSAEPGEVVVVGNQPLLRPQAAGTGRGLSLHANPGAYQLLCATSLAEPVTWTPILTYQQTNVVQTVSLDPTIPLAFYQLLQGSSAAAPPTSASTQ